MDGLGRGNTGSVTQSGLILEQNEQSFLPMRSCLTDWTRFSFSFAVAAFGLGLLFSPPLRAHKVSTASLILYLDTEKERTYRIEMAMEVESSGDAATDDEIGPEDAARAFSENYLMVLIDEKEQLLKIETELASQSDPETPEELQKLAVIVTIKGILPDDAKEFALFLRETSPVSIVIATVEKRNYRAADASDVWRGIQPGGKYRTVVKRRSFRSQR